MEHKNMYVNSKDALAAIMREYGAEVLLGNRLKNFFNDYAPGMKKSRKNVVFFVADSGAAEILKRNLGAGAEEQEIAFRQAVQKVIDECPIERSEVECVMLEFTAALGWKINIQPQKPPMQLSEEKQTQSSPTQKEQQTAPTLKNQQKAASVLRKPSASPTGLNTKNLTRPKRRRSALKYAIYARKKGIIKGIIIAVSALVLAVSAIWGINSYNSYVTDKKITNVESLISKLPAAVSDYSYFEQEIMNAYTAYMELAPELQNQVENADKLTACMEEFNLYQTGLVRQTLAEVSEESVQNTDVLERLHQLYSKLTAEQRALLTRDENQALEQASYAYVTIKGINDLLGDVVGKYDTVSEIKKNYIQLTDYYKGLIYNYSELDAIEETYNLQKSLDFSAAGGGWAVSVKEDARNSLSGNIVIPSEYKGQPVTTIPEGAFSGCTGISSITIPDSVTSIGEKAFSGCLNLQSITLPFVGASRTADGYEGLFGYIFGRDSYSGGVETRQYYTDINGDRTNYIPSQLKEVTITDAVQLSYGAFQNCSMLAAINLNSEIVGAGSRVFEGCSGITTVNIPGITVISESMFSGCSSLKTLSLGKEVMRIEKNAFKGCVNLSSLNSEVEGEIVIGNSIQFIGENVFSGCIKIKSITLPFVGASRTADGYEGLFGYIFGRDSYSGGVETRQYCSKINGDRTNYIPSQLKEVTITDAVQLSYGAFYNCSMLSRLTINSGAKNSVGSEAFTNCISPKWN